MIVIRIPPEIFSLFLYPTEDLVHVSREKILQRLGRQHEKQCIRSYIFTKVTTTVPTILHSSLSSRWAWNGLFWPTFSRPCVILSVDLADWVDGDTDPWTHCCQATSSITWYDRLLTGRHWRNNLHRSTSIDRVLRKYPCFEPDRKYSTCSLWRNTVGIRASHSFPRAGASTVIMSQLICDLTIAQTNLQTILIPFWSHWYTWHDAHNHDVMSDGQWMNSQYLFLMTHNAIDDATPWWQENYSVPVPRATKTICKT